MKRSDIFIFCCLSFIIGIGFGLLIEISFLIIYILFLAGIILLVLFWRNINLRILFFGILFLFFGIARATPLNPPLARGDIKDGEKVSVKGVIFNEVEVSNDKQKFTVRVELAFKTPLPPLCERGEQNILVYTKLYPEYHYGDLVSMKCKLRAPEPFGNFRYDKYLAMDDIYSVCWYPEISIIDETGGNIVYKNILLFKKKADNIIRTYASEPQASILSAILLGNKYSLDSDLKDIFSRAGISHIIAISGMHIAILEMIILLFLIFLGISRKKAVWLLLILIFLYLVMIGAPTSAVRAAIIAFLAILAYSFGRLSKLLNIIFLAACIMLLAKPGILFYDISFQFSFTALIGIFYLFPVIKKWLEKIGYVLIDLKPPLTPPYEPPHQNFGGGGEGGEIGYSSTATVRLPAQAGRLGGKGVAGRVLNYLTDIISISLAAEIALLPLIIYYFGIFSLISPLVNLLVLWLVPVVMILGLILIFLGLISFFAPLNFILGLIISFFLKYMITIATFLVSFRWAAMDIEIFPLWGVIVYYAALVLCVTIAKK